METIAKIMGTLILFGVFLGLCVIPVCMWIYGWFTSNTNWSCLGMLAFFGIVLFIGGVATKVSL